MDSEITSAGGALTRRAPCHKGVKDRDNFDYTNCWQEDASLIADVLPLPAIREHQYPENQMIKTDIPKGLRLLRRATNPGEQYTVQVLNECCAAHLYPGKSVSKCSYRQECKRLYDAWCGQWALYKEVGPKPRPRQQTEIQKYSNWIPQLGAREVLAHARSN